ncbi:MAG: hypothetical protein E4H17_01705 [Gemmatimonadales bacterium]|nr:MAG: hypothetical protein E4H17_01705 [Gemmatimonadales bacterium]
MARDCERDKAGSPSERRRFGRFPTRLPITTRRDDLLGRGQDPCKAQCRLHLQDFSLGGLRAESPVPLKMNERITLRLPPSATQPALHLTGKVIHCRREKQRYHVGIAFCQTGEALATSPFRHLPRLFSLAADCIEKPEPVAIHNGI